ncbi:NAD(P)-binding domain-containing protein [Glycomyces albidus]|uniref:Pyrroline-5-carboxylate reductase n=1 Tax=Glycomyces albidus TaxID=2656774 RepID=A0A6L5G306_9ACTN|nr:NAD(P)-binding domain-containing protein [Glycomyces albidus]MQM24010.1 pyrroline-5-carboxylate reductase [Glycomyces albidus]
MDTNGSVGVVGVGEIASAIVEGRCAGANPPAFFLSPRGAANAAALARRFPSVRVCGSNQEVVDRADTVLLSVRYEHREAVLAGLDVRPEKTVVSALAGVGIAELRRLLRTDATLVRAIPLPAVRARASVTVVHPAHPAAAALFDPLGGTLAIPDEASFAVYSALTATVSTHLGYLGSLTEWAVAQGVPAEDAARYVRSMFRNVGLALGDESRSLDRLAADHETPGGNNEQVRTAWLDEENRLALHRVLDERLDRLR